MPYIAKANNDQKIIELTYIGEVTPAELYEALSKAASLSKEFGITRFLADCSTMLGGHSVADLYFLLNIYEESGLSRDMKEALILPSLESTAEEVKFYETACYNRGYKVKVFLNIPDALSWLLKE